MYMVKIHIMRSDWLLVKIPNQMELGEALMLKNTFKSKYLYGTCYEINIPLLSVVVPYDSTLQLNNFYKRP